MNQSRTIQRLLALLITLVVIAAACATDSDDLDETSGDDSEAAGQLATQSESDIADDAEESSDFAMEGEEAMEDDNAFVSPAQATTTVPSGGFFEADESDIEAGFAKREQDNTFQDYGVRSFIRTDQDPLSTFALDVDTASYSIARRWLDDGVVPPPESVRVEEYLNSFDYNYPAPSDGLTVVADGGPSPFDDNNIILRLGVQAEEVRNSDRPSASLTFVVDTSGSMDQDNRLGLVKTSLEGLVDELDRDDMVSIVTYSDQAQVLLEPTSATDDDIIREAIRRLAPTGSTNLEAGLRQGYALAARSFISGGINRVILASDGVANVGLVDPAGLVGMIRDDADRGIHLVTVGVGMGNFNDVTMEQLANDGDGFYAYVNNNSEAQKLFTEDLTSSLLTVAIDGKIQVEFDTTNVAEYRLLGYENRSVLDDDFRNDEVDAGELNAGHQVTALYELRLAPGVSSNARLGTAQLRWEDPDRGDVRETRLELTANMIESSWGATSNDFRLAVSVGALAETLRQSQYLGGVTLSQIGSEVEALSPGSGPIEELYQLVLDVERL